MPSRERDELPAVPSDWPLRSLADLATIVGGSTPSRNIPGYWNGTIPWVTPGELTGLKTKYLEATRDHITRAGLDSCGASLLPAEALLVTTRATLGSAALVRHPTATNQGFKSLVFSARADPSFFFHAFRRLGPELTRRASGTTFLEISGREFGRVRVAVPPLSEQRRIAEVLDTVDETIRKTEQLIAKLKQLKQGLLHDLLTRGINDKGELRDPERHPEQFKDTVIGRIPSQWTVQALSRFATLITKGTTPMTYGYSYATSGVPFLRVENLAEDGRIVLDNVLLIDDSTNRFLSRSRLMPGDVLVSIAGTIGRTAVVPANVSEANCNQAVALIRLAPTIVAPHFLRLFLASAAGQRSMLGDAVQLAQANLSLGQISATEIPVPPPREQAQIGATFDATESRIQVEAATLDKLRQLKAGLMEDLLTGRVRVPDGDHEVAA